MPGCPWLMVEVVGITPHPGWDKFSGSQLLDDPRTGTITKLTNRNIFQNCRKLSAILSDLFCLTQHNDACSSLQGISLSHTPGHIAPYKAGLGVENMESQLSENSVFDDTQKRWVMDFEFFAWSPSGPTRTSKDHHL